MNDLKNLLFEFEQTLKEKNPGLLKNLHFGRLFLHAPMLTFSEKPVSIYGSLEALLKTVIECYKQGAYSIGDHGALSVNYELEQQISRSINKDAEFWN
jgi:hypothetical protein